MTAAVQPIRSDSFVRGPSAGHFSSYVVADALSAGCELGILDVLADEGAYHLDRDDRELDPVVVERLLNGLVWGDVVRVEDGVARPGPGFADAYAARGYFYWMVRGCGALFSDAPRVARRDQRDGAFYSRDMRAVAVGSHLIGDTAVEGLYDALLNEREFGTLADLGCGSGRRLTRVAADRPGVRGIGVDIAPAAVKLAARSIEDAGLADRITVCEADVLDLPEIPGGTKVDVITCSFMGHDFWPYDRCVRTLRGLRRAFPNAGRLLLCDVVRSTARPGPDTPIFTLGFELVHALMGVYVPTREEWHDAFAASGWRCAAAHEVTAPPGGVMFDLEPVAAHG
ncbi:class I SAM-dependent methyltransferase [Actinocorallia sp. A-T 12471]|uniref:class I SAM-dependent methyltransferase n=1 Tax=Actinocorallia sp. A-T 12471 TaxID=3089813 RepID=UPI0029CB1B6A|nr:class I SAM-dependent methyltransferase [Actinocorallia sp. A-T 12471]MDX6740237.1 class I SAM-dependent methyltransferase [Actinocorallia sp. A-T 12471]